MRLGLYPCKLAKRFKIYDIYKNLFMKDTGIDMNLTIV